LVGRTTSDRPPRRPAASGTWTVYLALCADETLYCGIARDLEARIRQHDAGKGARYTRGRGPLRVLATKRCRRHGVALRLELLVKALTRKEKLELAGAPEKLARLARKARRAPNSRDEARARNPRHRGDT
jgi:putative endonuclease